MSKKARNRQKGCCHAETFSEAHLFNNTSQIETTERTVSVIKSEISCNFYIIKKRTVSVVVLGQLMRSKFLVLTHFLIFLIFNFSLEIAASKQDQQY